VHATRITIFLVHVESESQDSAETASKGVLFAFQQIRPVVIPNKDLVTDTIYRNARSLRCTSLP
jgi:hypothetical protein